MVWGVGKQQPLPLALRGGGTNRGKPRTPLCVSATVKGTCLINCDTLVELSIFYWVHSIGCKLARATPSLTHALAMAAPLAKRNGSVDVGKPRRLGRAQGRKSAPPLCPAAGIALEDVQFRWVENGCPVRVQEGVQQPKRILPVSPLGKLRERLAAARGFLVPRIQQTQLL